MASEKMGNECRKRNTKEFYLKIRLGATARSNHEWQGSGRVLDKVKDCAYKLLLRSPAKAQWPAKNQTPNVALPNVAL